MKCCCGIHREMYSAASSIWAGSAVAFPITFYLMDLQFTSTNILYWWATTVTLRLMTVETVRLVVLYRRLGKRPWC